MVLRIDSGGGGVVDSDSIDQAVRDLREKKGKIVISSFSNAAASGGYLAACHTDAILAHRKPDMRGFQRPSLTSSHVSEHNYWIYR